MENKKVLFISQEIDPYIENTLIGKLSQKLCQGIQENGYDIRTFMPNYGSINERRNQLHEVIRLSGMLLNINDQDNPLIVKVATLSSAKMQVYFIENKDLFNTKTGVYDKNGKIHENNVERAAFFARGVFETVKKLRWIPDIIHCQGWFSGLAVLYLREMYKDDPIFKDSKVVFSFFDSLPDQPFGKDLKEVLEYDGITSDLIDENGLDKHQFIELIVSQIDGATFSPSNIADETIEALKKYDVPYTQYKDEEDIVEKIDAFYKTLI